MTLCRITAEEMRTRDVAISAGQLICFESRPEGRAQSSVQWIPVRRYAQWHAQAEIDANETVRSFGAPRRIANLGSGDANVDIVVYR